MIIKYYGQDSAQVHFRGYDAELILSRGQGQMDRSSSVYSIETCTLSLLRSLAILAVLYVLLLIPMEQVEGRHYEQIQKIRKRPQENASQVR